MPLQGKKEIDVLDVVRTELGRRSCLAMNLRKMPWQAYQVAIKSEPTGRFNEACLIESLNNGVCVKPVVFSKWKSMQRYTADDST